MLLKKGLLLFLVSLLFILPLNVHAEVFINELLANGVNDPDTEWIELFNNDSKAINQTNWKLSETSSGNFTFNVAIPAKGFVVLAADFDTFISVYPKVNSSGIKIINITISSFNLADTSGEVNLYDGNGNLADKVSYAQASGKTFENVSIGRYPDGGTSIFNLSTLTPGKKNDNKAPTLNKWINPSSNNTRISGLVNVMVNITDDASEVESATINFNGTNFAMARNGLWSFLWNTSLNFGKTYNLTVFFNDSYGKAGFDNLFNITVDNKPFIVSFSPPNLAQTIFEDSALNFSVNASDPDDSLLSFSWFIDAILNKSNTKNFSYKPGFGDNGTHFINVTINDPSSNQVSLRWTVLVKKQNRAPILNEIGDKNAFKSLILSFNLTAADPDNDDLTFSSNHSGMTITKISNSLALVSWKPKNTDLGNNVVNFTVSDGLAVDSKIVRIFVGFTNNSAPVITSTPITIATQKEQYNYDVEAFDLDNDTLFFSLKSNASNIFIDALTGLITFNPNSVGFFSVNVSAADLIDSAQQSFGIKVSPGSKLKIEGVDVKVDNKKKSNLKNLSLISEEAEPGSKLEFKVTVRNDFSRQEDVKIEGIKVKITIEGIDDGDDLEGESKKFDLSAQDDKEVKLIFDLPTNIDENTFDVLIEAEGNDENGNVYEQFFKLKLDVEKKRHDLRFVEFSISPDLISCQKSILARYTIINVGQEDEENAAFEIKNEKLGFMQKQSPIKIDSGTEDNTFSSSLRLSLDRVIEAGEYTIVANAYSDDGKLQDTKEAKIKAKGCIKTKADKESVVLNLGQDALKTETVQRQIVPSKAGLPAENKKIFTLLLISTFIFTLFFVSTALIAFIRLY